MNHQEDDNVQLFRDMVIPDYILMGPDEVVNEAPKCPVLVFINSKSGGQLGTQLLPSCCALLNPNQVFDLSKEEPDKVLDRVLCNLEKRIGEGDNYAANIRSNLKIIVAGGDGTASWLLGIIGDLRLPHPPPIATLPLGTGNNLPYTFGWGRKNPGTDVNSVKNFLQKVTKAKPMNIDSWNVVLKMDDTTNEPLEPIELPHSLHPIKRVCKLDELHEEGKHIFRGGFWNYFSIGMDAQVSYEFDQKRHQNPGKFKNQFKNQGTYVAIGYKQGWFKVSCFHPTSRNINMLGKIEIAKHKGEWRDLIVPSSIRSIVMLNLPSFSGGLNPWGIPSDKKSTKRGFTAPFVDDGLLDLVGFRDAWHGLTLLSPYGHGTRLAQAHKVRIAFHEGSVDHAYMRMDGEPWQQPLPKGDATTVIEITHQGQAVMLASENCIARSVQHQDGKEHIHTEEGGVGQ